MTVKVKKLSNPKEHGVRHVTRGSDNIFEDLGFEHEEATQLLAETDAAIMKRLAMRQMLADVVVVWIDENNLKQAQAAEILHISRPRVSDLVRKQVTKFSVDTLLDLVFRTGKSVTLHVG